MIVKYKHPAIVPTGIELETEYELTIKGDKAIISREGTKLEFTKYQAEDLFEVIENK